jgi:peptide deformylase
VILPIVAYGDNVLRVKCKDIEESLPGLSDLISDMFDTLYDAEGVGLAAPQIGLAIRLFIVDADPFKEDEPGLENFKKVFINPQIIEEEGEEWGFKEGCLSIPGIRENVNRLPKLKISYYDEGFTHHEEYFEGLAARVIQHEYDHVEGVLFIDKITPMKKRMLKGKLTDITKGKVRIHYRMRFPKK